MNVKKIKNFIIMLMSIIMVFSMNTVAFAAEDSDTSLQFGDVLYADKGITVFYGNPNENTALAEEIEAEVASTLKHDYIWVDANTSTVGYAEITASSSNPLTYFTIRQEASSAVTRSRVTVTRPNNDGTCYYSSWDGTSTKEVSDLTISTSVLWSEPFGRDAYSWTSGTLTLKWNVTTGDSGARMNLWAW